MSLLKTTLIASMVVFAPSVAFSQEHGAHQAMMSAAQEMNGAPEYEMAIEPGQGAFAAIAEIVALLSADPTTNWARVDIDALRKHLVDMNQLTLHAVAQTNVTDGRVQFQISGVDRVFDAIQAMVPAHAEELDNSTNWSVSAELTEAGATLTLASAEDGELEKIAALGFFGIMATGAHHQAHHVLIARGETAH